jgi:hypothetical protein
VTRGVVILEIDPAVEMEGRIEKEIEVGVGVGIAPVRIAAEIGVSRNEGIILAAQDLKIENMHKNFDWGRWWKLSTEKRVAGTAASYLVCDLMELLIFSMMTANMMNAFKKSMFASWRLMKLSSTTKINELERVSGAEAIGFMATLLERGPMTCTTFNMTLAQKSITWLLAISAH